jgi:hypothetical protein
MFLGQGIIVDNDEWDKNSQIRVMGGALRVKGLAQTNNKTVL